LLSAAATLQKSLPPTSGKKSPFKSAKKIRAPTPRQSRSKEVIGACPNSSLKAVCNEVVEKVGMVAEEAEVGVVAEEAEVGVVAEEVEVVVEEAVVVVEEVDVVVEEVEVVAEEAEVAVVIEGDVVVVEEVEVVVVAEEAEVAALVEEVAVVVEEVEVEVVAEEAEVAVVVEEFEVEVVAEEAEVAVVVEEVAEVAIEKSSDPTPARSTRSKVSTPSIPAPSEDLTVKKTRSTRKGTALAPVVSVATESVFDLENTAEKEAEPEISTVTKGRQKRGVAVEIISTTKRSRRVQDAISAESSSVVPDNIDFADQADEVREVAPAVAVDPTPIKSIGKVLRSSKKTPLVADVPVEEVKVAGKGRGKGKATKGVMQAIELEEAEEEDEEELEEALALLCDG
jgi:hypothetical protein